MLLVSAGMDASLKFFDISKKNKIKELNLSAPISAIDFQVDGYSIAVGDISGNNNIY